MQQHQGPRPETLAQLAQDGMGYEIVVREGHSHGVTASVRLYGRRRAKWKTEQIVKWLELQGQKEKGGGKDAIS